MKTIELNPKSKNFLASGTETLRKADFLNRLLEKDATLWKKDSVNKNIISNALGWVNIADEMLKDAEEITKFVNSIKSKFNYCIVLGMGGSSLAPEVFRTVFKNKKGYPKLFVLDTTNPEQILDTERQLNLKKTLFIVASKSGTTTEPHSQLVYFYGKLKKSVKNAGQNFIAITDAETELVKLAEKLNFRKTFINPSDIGGRFSALSYFGLVPAAIMGIDIKKLLKRAVGFSKKYLKTYSQNPALMLGALLGNGYLKGIDKLTLVMPKKLQPFGLWIEQLIAESTGKEGKGIVPIVHEPVIENFNYCRDRIFVNFMLGNKNDKTLHRHIKTLKKKKYPVIDIKLSDVYDLGIQFYLWELATAAAGFVLKINPFSQPDVEQSKIFMRNILKSASTRKKEKEIKEIQVLYSKSAIKKIKSKKLENLPQNFYSFIKKNYYVGILAYLPQNPQIHSLLRTLRRKITVKKNVPTLFGYGPRYLHSTGQLHKGGGTGGVFLIIESCGKPDIIIPKKPYTFRQLISSQSLGDFKHWSQKKRLL